MWLNQPKEQDYVRYAPTPAQSAAAPQVNMLDVRDAIDRGILSAQALELAIIGEGQASGFDSNVLETIVRRHIRELQAIAASLEKHAA
jgi:hypothetical protein